jgi:hypothetical protein
MGAMNHKQLMEDIERVIFYSGVGSGASVGMNPLDKVRAGLVKLFVPELDTRGVAAFKSLREAYIAFSGDDGFTGLWNPAGAAEGLRSCQDFTASSFAYAMQNALSMYLSKEYKAFPYREEILISERKEAKDFRTIHSVQIGYFGDLPDVDPEAGDYEGLTSIGDDEEAQYDLSPKGGILWITRRVIMNDSIDLVKALVKRGARAARMTHAKYVWSFYLNNATCPDSTAWFTSGHGNLATDALDYAPLVTAITALANMTEPGSGEKLGLDLQSFKWHLVVPIDLWDTGVKKNQGDSYYSSNDLTDKVPNACRHLFGADNERVVVCPFGTDANDWGVIRDVEDVPIIEISYYAGKQEPEFIVEQGPTEEHCFRADRIGYKIRHEYGGTLAGYRGGYKSVVT